MYQLEHCLQNLHQDIQLVPTNRPQAEAPSHGAAIDQGLSGLLAGRGVIVRGNIAVREQETGSVDDMKTEFRLETLCYLAHCTCNQ